MDDTINAELDALLQEEASAVPREKAVELLKQKNHWKEKAVDPVTGKHYKTLLEESVAAQSQPKPEPTAAVPQTVTREDLAEIRLQNKGLSDDAIRAIKAFAKGQGKDPMDVLDDPFVQSALKAQQTSEAVQQAVPSPTGRTIAVDGKSIKEMTPSERKARWGEIVGAATRK